MKNNLGKALCILFCLPILLYAEDFTTTIKSSSYSPYVKEAIILDVYLQQTNPKIVLLFKFDLAPSPHYTFKRITVSEKENYHDLRIHYRYLLYPLQEGKINVHFNLLKKKTSDESVAYSFSGDRDNVKTLETQDSTISLSPLTLTIKALPKGTQLVGDFKLKYTIPKHQGDAHEPLPFHIQIKGVGHTPILKEIFTKQDTFMSFMDKPQIQASLKKEKNYTSVNYTMALSAESNFSLPSLVWLCFNPQTQKSYTLNIPAQTFEINPIDTDNLIDTINSPKSLKIHFLWLESFLGYLVTFIAGILTAIAFKWRKVKKVTTKHPLIEKISQSQNPKILLQVLLAHPHPKLDTIIQQLENALYQQSTISFSTLKKEAQSLLENTNV